MINNEILKRRSIRKYIEKPVENDKIIKILEAGRVAPSGKNKQPWRYIVFGGDNKKGLLDAMEQGIQREKGGNTLLPESTDGILDAINTLKIMREAPITIIVLNPLGKSPFEQISVDDRFSEIVNTLSIGASIENMILRATELGIGSLWIANTCFAYDEMRNYIGTNDQLVGAIALGYSAESPNMRPRKSLDDIVEYRI